MLEQAAIRVVDPLPETACLQGSAAAAEQRGRLAQHFDPVCCHVLVEILDVAFGLVRDAERPVLKVLRQADEANGELHEVGRGSNEII